MRQRGKLRTIAGDHLGFWSPGARGMHRAPARGGDQPLRDALQFVRTHESLDVADEVNNKL
jgi:hypothetical protein